MLGLKLMCLQQPFCIDKYETGRKARLQTHSKLKMINHLWLQALRVARLLLLTVCIAATVANSERSDAFIGYREDTSNIEGSKCQDKEDGCALWQKAGECLANPYYMRFKCARSCHLPSCVKYDQRVAFWKGHATEYHTKQYTTRLVLPSCVEKVKASHQCKRRAILRLRGRAVTVTVHH